MKNVAEGNTPICQNCEARNGETYKTYRERIAGCFKPHPELDTKIFHVRKTEHGTFCQWCAVHTPKRTEEANKVESRKALLQTASRMVRERKNR